MSQVHLLFAASCVIEDNNHQGYSPELVMWNNMFVDHLPCANCAKSDVFGFLVVHGPSLLKIMRVQILALLNPLGAPPFQSSPVRKTSNIAVAHTQVPISTEEVFLIVALQPLHPQ